MPASTAASPTPASIGSNLRVARLEQNITLRQVADATHISLRHLQNIEEGRYSDLPGGMYDRAFLRAYCAYLKLDPEPYLLRFNREIHSQLEKNIRTRRRDSLPSHPVRTPPVLIWTVMLVASIAGLYFSRGWIAEVFSPYFAHPPAAARLPEPAPPPAPEPAKPAIPAVPEPAATAAGQPAAEPLPGSIRLQFEGLESCWLSLTGDGVRMFYGILRPGETQTFDARERFELILGNAGGVSLKINGKPAKPLGKPGAVVKLDIDEQTIPALVEKVVS